MMQTVLLGLGTNVGDRIAFLAAAVRGIADMPGTVVDDVSSVYETEPVGDVPQPPYLNLCLSAQTSLEVESFHRHIKELERAIGRNDSVRWGPREIDIDILLFGQTVRNDERLHIPHREMVNRNFVLRPLAEIAPNAVHPLLRKSVTELNAASADRHAADVHEVHTHHLMSLINDSIAHPTV
ncbi:MAG: 2-amino-4-hydroxy-6-hydroxymethyldihydropteridine diphosphokinase [Bacteroidetes bacterium]|nr:MAG: 2-amino-4-hydroxy-6-hydroxymethyldihydropteridine diphosphokinase [Bacteroidota bacterium]